MFKVEHTRQVTAPLLKPILFKYVRTVRYYSTKTGNPNRDVTTAPKVRIFNRVETLNLFLTWTKAYSNNDVV